MIVIVCLRYGQRQAHTRAMQAADALPANTSAETDRRTVIRDGINGLQDKEWVHNTTTPATDRHQ